jgi:hypothetical protein
VPDLVGETVAVGLTDGVFESDDPEEGVPV